MSDDTEKLERLVEKGVRLRKGIAMGGMESPSNVEHSMGAKAPKMPKASGLAKRNKSAY